MFFIFRWMNHLCEKRNKYYHLNHFNIHQLTYLCKKISLSEAADFPDQVYQLLSVIAPNIAASDIVACLEEVTKIDDVLDDEDDSCMLGDFLKFKHFCIIKYFYDK